MIITKAGSISPVFFMVRKLWPFKRVHLNCLKMCPLSVCMYEHDYTSNYIQQEHSDFREIQIDITPPFLIESIWNFVSTASDIQNIPIMDSRGLVSEASETRPRSFRAED